jgi:hypothetical protein
MANEWNLPSHISGVMVIMLASSAVDHGFKPWLEENKEYKIGICCLSAKHTTFLVKVNAGWLEIRIMCPSGATCLPWTVVSVN